MNNAIRQIGSALGVALAIALAGHATANVQAFQHVYLCLVAAGAAMALLAQPLVPIPTSLSSEAVE